MRHVYFDHAATTPTDPRVSEAMLPYMGELFGNPSALYRSGRVVKEAIFQARKSIAAILGVRPEELYFTGGGTESDALAIFGVMKKSPGHMITATTEHHAVLYNAEELEKSGKEVTFVPVDSEGIVRLDELKSAIRPDTTLVSIMYVNNEIGAVAPLKEMAKIIQLERERRKLAGEKLPIWFHTDACQAAGYLTLEVQKLGVDLMTINGSKIYGPKGIGLLYVKRGVKIAPLWQGGGQEQRIRSGTEHVAGIIGLAKALEIVQEKREEENMRLLELRDYFIQELFTKVPKIVLNGPAHPAGARHGGHPTLRLPNNVNVSVLDIEGEAFLLYLDRYGIEASTGSACDSITLDPSHVILALGKPYEFAHASMRFTLGRSTIKADIDYAMLHIPSVVEILRQISSISLDLDATSMSHAGAFAGEGLPHWEVKRGTKLKNMNAQEHENIKQ